MRKTSQGNQVQVGIVLEKTNRRYFKFCKIQQSKEMLVGSGANAQSTNSFETRLKQAFLQSKDLQSCLGKSYNTHERHHFLIRAGNVLFKQFKSLLLDDPEFQVSVIDKITKRFEANQVSKS